MTEETEKIHPKRDPLREPPLRYLGYANEVGEAFRSQVPVKFVWLSYAVASGYVVADAIHKGIEAKNMPQESELVQHNRIRWAVADTFIWQGLASVIIPGFTINRVCWASNHLLRKRTKLPGPIQKWVSTMVGLACIPFIIRPIDKSVDFIMECTLRKKYKRTPDLDVVITHSRNQ